MNALVAAAGSFGLPVAEELVRACWGIQSLFYDSGSPGGNSYERLQKQVSFPVKPVISWARFWPKVDVSSKNILFLVGCPEPDLNELKAKPCHVYALQAGLLPGQAGPDAAAWAIYRGEPSTGVSFYRRGKKPYSGDLLFQKSCTIEDSDDAVSLEGKLRELAVEAVCSFWEMSTRAQLRPLGLVAASSVHPRWKGGKIAWRQSAARVHNFVRACANSGGALSAHRKTGLAVLKTVLGGRSKSAAKRPGTVESIAPLRVWAEDGLVGLARVRPEGRPEMSGAAFARTAGVKPGSVLTGAASFNL